MECKWVFEDKGCTCASDPEWLGRFMDRLASVVGDEAIYGPDEDEDEDEQAEE